MSKRKRNTPFDAVVINHLSNKCDSTTLRNLYQVNRKFRKTIMPRLSHMNWELQMKLVHKEFFLKFGLHKEFFLKFSQHMTESYYHHLYADWYMKENGKYIRTQCGKWVVIDKHNYHPETIYFCLQDYCGSSPKNELPDDCYDDPMTSDGTHAKYLFIYGLNTCTMIW